MATQDRGVGLAELAARAQSGAARGSRSDCRNPECRNGMTPGLVATGGGNKGQPLFGAGGVGAKRLMRWAWVQCLACNPPEGARRAGAIYKHLVLTQAQIAQREQLANSKAPYQAETREGPSRPRPGSVAAPSVDSKLLTELGEQNKKLTERLDEMLKQNAEMTQTLSRMSMQIAALLEDNAKLRAAQTQQPAGGTAATLMGVGP